VAGVSRRSALVVGTIHHRRHRPRPNAFRYGAYWTLIDVDELAELDRRVPGFGYRRRALTSFRDTDHLGPADVPVRLKLARWLADRGVELPDGHVQVLTSLRVLGHVFNPVSWWFCHDRDGRLALVVAEVDNTFGDSHAYLLDQLEHRADGTVRATAPKAFHVSPFLDVAGHRYGFVFALAPDRVLVKMDVWQVADDGDPGDDRPILEATQDGRLVALTGANLTRTLLRFPLITLRTVYLIHRQALRLWRLRTPFFRRPTPPPDGYERLGEPRTTSALAPTAPTILPPPDAEPVATTAARHDVIAAPAATPVEELVP
jgi:uncharacterized protein